MKKNFNPGGVRSYTTIIAIFLSLPIHLIAEDYFLNFESNSIQNLPPNGLQATVLSDSAAVLQWQSVNAPNETEWDMEIVRAGNTFSGNPTHPNINANPISLDTLASGMAYEFRVRAICFGAAGNWSNSTGKFFTHLKNSETCGTDLVIPDFSCATPTNFPIEVTNAAGDSLGRNVILQELNLIIEHDWLIDLEIYLEAPSGKKILILDEAGGTNTNFGDPNDPTCATTMTLLNANACSEQLITDANPPFTSRYLPLGDFNRFNDLTNPNGTWNLIICDDASTHEGRLKHVELVFAPVNCSAPSGLEVVSVDSTFVVLDWAPGGFCGDTKIEIGAPGFSPGSGTVINASCPPFMLTGLSGGSDFEAYIFENCDDGSRSPYSCSSVTFTTECSPPPVSISENFDAMNKCFGLFCTNTCDIENSFWYNARNDRMEWTVYDQQTWTSGTGPSDDVSGGGKYIFMETTSSGFFGRCDAGSEAILLSNCAEIKTGNTDTCHVSFNYHMFGNFINTLSFEITTDGQNWTSLWSKSGNQGDVWKEVKLSLSAYKDSTAQFRFLGTRGNGNAGDIAIDEIKFYGTQETGAPQYVFYLDNDLDGYGDDQTFSSSCFDFNLPGFISIGGDCDDNNPNIHPNATEIPCNFIDENCNGTGDEFFLSPPIVMDSINICEGESVTLTASPTGGGDISWYDDNFNYLSGDNSFTINNLTADGSNPKTYIFLAEESVFICVSGQPAQVKVVVHPKPEIATADVPTICKNEIFDLQSLQFSDSKNTSGTLSFHTGIPATDGNKLPNSLVTPNVTTTFFIKKTTAASCFDTTSVTINVLPAPTATISIFGETTPAPDSIQLCKGDAIFLSGNSSGGVGNHDFLWSSLETGDFVRIGSSAISGDENWVTFAATDENGCTDIDSILVRTVSSVNTVEVEKTEASICNGNDGTIKLNPIDGTPTYHFDWSGPVSGNGSSGGDFTLTNLEQGSYSITVIDSSPENCPLVLNNLVIDGPSAKVALDFIRPTLCFGDSTGGISLTVTGNNPTISWSPISANTEDVSNLPAGTYSVTVSDGACESILDNLVIPQPDSIYALTLPSDVNCFGGNDGSIAASVFGGSQPYRFNWDNAPNVQNPSNLSTGFYRLTVTDFNNCSYISDSIEIVEPTDISINPPTLVHPECFGFSTGKIDLDATGGTGAFQYFWSDGGTGKSRVGLSAGNYAVTVKDANGCEKVMSGIEILNPDSIEISIDSINPATCLGLSDGGIFTTVSGGTGNLNFEWNNAAGNEDLNNLPAGFYNLKVWDTNGCQADTTIEVTAPSLLTVDKTVRNPQCDGRTDGSITLDTLIGGTAPFEYLWSDASQNRNLDSIGNGFYSLTITDSAGCITNIDSIAVEGIQQLNADDLQALSPICHGGENGTILTNISNGNGTINYQWSDPNLSGNNPDNLKSGFYSVTVTDQSDCRLEIDSIEITEPDSLVSFEIAIDQINCFGDASGSISVGAAGGVSPYLYSWNGGIMTDSTISNLPAGTYTFSVKDSVGCLVEHAPIILNNPDSLRVEAVVMADDGDCTDNQPRDTILLLTSGGVGPLNYNWSNGTGNNMLTNMKPGEYAVTVTDINGCSVELTELKVPISPLTFQFDTYEKTDISCYGTNDGSVTISFDGGTAPYQFSWSEGIGDTIGGITNNQTISFDNLEPNSYNLTVVDSRGCEIESAMVDVLSPFALSAIDTEINPIKCYGGRNGNINIQVTGGSFPYNFQWMDSIGNSFGTNQNAINLPVGEYMVSITDANDCVWALQNMKITQPDSFFMEVTDNQPVRCKGDTTGSVDLAVTGGNFGYFVSWGNNNFGASRDDLVAGTHGVTITDAKGCVLQDSIEITEPDSLFMPIDFGQIDPTCNGATNGLLCVDFAGGVRPYNFFYGNVPTNDNCFENIGAGTDTLLAIDSNGCRFDTTFTFTDPPEIMIGGTINDVSSPFLSDGRIIPTIGGGTPPLTFVWDDGTDTLNRSNLGQGTYILSVRDSLNCELSGVFKIDVTSGINDLEFDGTISLAPNPTSGLLQVNFDLNNPASFSGKLLTADGRLLREFDLKNVVKRTEKVDLTQEADGVYFLVLENETGRKSWRVFKVSE